MIDMSMTHSERKTSREEIIEDWMRCIRKPKQTQAVLKIARDALINLGVNEADIPQPPPKKQKPMTESRKQCLDMIKELRKASEELWKRKPVGFTPPNVIEAHRPEHDVWLRVLAKPKQTQASRKMAHDALDTLGYKGERYEPPRKKRENI